MRLSRAVLGLVLGRRLARLDGVVRVDGAADEVVIRRDRWGVLHVGAQSEADAWFGLGFCVGQDRAFQLESLVRTVRGTVAELVGPGGLGVDRLSRRIGFRRSALRHFAATPPPPNYDDQLQRFQVSKGIPIPWSPRDIDSSTEHTLICEPPRKIRTPEDEPPAEPLTSGAITRCGHAGSRSALCCWLVGSAALLITASLA